MAFDVLQMADILESDILYAMLRTEKQPVYQNKSACEKQTHSFEYCKIIPHWEKLLWPISNSQEIHALVFSWKSTWFDSIAWTNNGHKYIVEWGEDF